MTFLQGIGILCGIILTALAVYLIVRLGFAAYFRSLREHQIWMSYAYWKRTFDRRKTPREVIKGSSKIDG